MKYRKKSKTTIAVSALLTALFMCGATYSGVYASGQTAQIPSSATTPNQAQTVIYEKVEMNWGKGEEDFNHIVNIRTNNTTKKIMSTDRAMLAFDKDGNPLKLDWWSRDTMLNDSYLQVHSGLTREVLPGQTDEQKTGWRLNAKSFDPSVEKIAYVLFCDKTITFEDGTIWENLDFEQWVAAYEGKATKTEILESYYPYEQKIEFQ